MKKSMIINENTHTKLDVLRAENKLKSFDEAINFLIESFKEKEDEQ